jgi:hypothetical protein
VSLPSRDQAAAVRHGTHTSNARQLAAATAPELARKAIAHHPHQPQAKATCHRRPTTARVTPCHWGDTPR